MPRARRCPTPCSRSSCAAARARARSIRRAAGWWRARSASSRSRLSATVPGSRPFVDTTSTEFDVVPGPAVRMELAPSSRDDRRRPVAPARRARLLQGQRPHARRPCAGSRAGPRSSRWTGDGMITGLAPGPLELTASVRGASASLDVRVVPAGRSRSSRSQAVEAVGAPGRRGRVQLPRRGTAPAIRWRGSGPTWSFAPGDGQLDADGRFVAYRPGDLHRHRLARPAFGEHHGRRWSERDVRRSVTVVGRLPRHRLRHVRGLDPSQRQGRLPRHPPGRRPRVRHRHQRSRQAGGGRFDHGEHPARERHADHRRRQRHGLHPRGSRGPEERHRHRRHPRPAAPEGDRAVHRRRRRGRALGLHLREPAVRPVRLHHQRRHRRDRHRQPQRPRAIRSGPASGAPTAPTPRATCTTSTSSTG